MDRMPKAPLASILQWTWQTVMKRIWSSGWTVYSYQFDVDQISNNFDSVIRKDISARLPASYIQLLVLLVVIDLTVTPCLVSVRLNLVVNESDYQTALIMVRCKMENCKLIYDVFTMYLYQTNCIKDDEAYHLTCTEGELDTCVYSPWILCWISSEFDILMYCTCYCTNDRCSLEVKVTIRLQWLQ